MGQYGHRRQRTKGDGPKKEAARSYTSLTLNIDTLELYKKKKLLQFRYIAFQRTCTFSSRYRSLLDIFFIVILLSRIDVLQIVLLIRTNPLGKRELPDSQPRIDLA